jgi:hypothetical protein
MGIGIPILGDLIDGVKDIVSELIVDPDKKAEINLELARLADEADKRLHEEMIAQAETNKVEAGHRSIFVAGWRPFIGWVSGAGVAWTFVVGPVVEWISRLSGWTGQMPELEVGQLMALITAMLGVGVMRSFDKAVGTSNDVLSAPPSSPPPQSKQPRQPRQGLLEKLLPDRAPWDRGD